MLKLFIRRTDMRLNLNGAWLFKNNTDESKFYDAIIPSTNYSDLLRNNLILDPFEKLNEKLSTWVGDKDWLYKKSFSIDKEILDSESILLKAECLDCIAEIYINNNLIAKTRNAHLGYSFEIKKYLQLGENILEILFISPNKYAKSEQMRISKTHNVKGLDKRIFIRKNQSHFDWDWGPEIPYCGITKDIYIAYGNGIDISNICVKQEHTNNFVNLDISFNVDGNLDNLGLTYYYLKITSPNGEVIVKTGVLNKLIKRTILIENPILWWTHELNPVDEQPLYNLEILIGENGSIAKKEMKIGLRTIELDRSKDKYGSNFRFILNGVPIFAKGANWIPADSLADRLDKDTYNFYIDSAVNSNMNMIRVWGGGFYESNEFYDACDRRGILIWQDCCFACRPYPFFDDQFLCNVKEEIAYNVKRLRNHPSLALWCGNNELEQMFNTWFIYLDFVKANKKFFWQELEDEIRKYDDSTAFIPTSPVGVEFNKAVSSDNHGDNHLWIVWHGLQDVKYYRKRDTRFCSEFGFESMPDIKTIERFADKEDYSIKSKVFLGHQKCMLGNQKMEYYITSRFRLPKNFEDYIYLSQCCQMECIKDATEYWRRNRERSNGSLYWQLNDCWPVCSWSSIDYYGNYKALQYHAKHFFAPVCVSMEYDKKFVKVFLLNDTLIDKDLDLKLRIVDFEKGVVDELGTSHKVPHLSTSIVYNIPIKDIKNKYDLKNISIICDLFDGNTLINTKTLLFKYEKYLKLKAPNIKLNAKVDNDIIKISLTADKFARLVRVTDKTSMQPFSDNYFDIIPGEEKVITLPYYDGFNESNLEVFSSVDVVPKGSKVYDAFVKAKFILNPVNLAVYLAQPQSNFDYKDSKHE